MPGATARSLLLLGWPSEPYGDAPRMRRLGLLAQTLGERLRDELRERLGRGARAAALKYFHVPVVQQQLAARLAELTAR